MTEATRAGPVGQTDRIVSLDVLRGFAVLGILVMNIQSFSMPDAAYFNPYAYGDLQGLNYAIWLLGHVLVLESRTKADRGGRRASIISAPEYQGEPEAAEGGWDPHDECQEAQASDRGGPDARRKRLGPRE